MNHRTRRGLVALAAALAAVTSAPSLAALLNPIATAGHDQDVVFETGLADGATGANGELGSRQFFEEGATSPDDDGLLRMLPPYVSTITGDTISYAFQPFEQNNVLKFDSAAAVKTLTLTTPAAYTHLAVAFSGGSLATATEVAGLTYTIHYADSTTQTGVLNVPDWGAAPLPAGTERLFIADRTTANASTWPITSDNNTTANRWSIYVSQIPPNSTSNILSVDFGPVSLNDADGLLNSGDDVVVFGLAGTLVPEPATSLLALFAIVGLVRRRRK
jgi:hypothetical protein